MKRQSQNCYKSIHGCGNCDEADIQESITMDTQRYQLLDNDETVLEVNTIGDTEEDENCDFHHMVKYMLSKCLRQQTETNHLFMNKNLKEVAAAMRQFKSATASQG